MFRHSAGLRVTQWVAYPMLEVPQRSAVLQRHARRLGIGLLVALEDRVIFPAAQSGGLRGRNPAECRFKRGRRGVATIQASRGLLIRGDVYVAP